MSTGPHEQWICQDSELRVTKSLVRISGSQMSQSSQGGRWARHDEKRGYDDPTSALPPSRPYRQGQARFEAQNATCQQAPLRGTPPPAYSGPFFPGAGGWNPGDPLRRRPWRDHLVWIKPPYSVMRPRPALSRGAVPTESHRKGHVEEARLTRKVILDVALRADVAQERENMRLLGFFVGVDSWHLTWRPGLPPE